MDGLPVTIRLLDPPLHEFLPDLTDAGGARWPAPRSAATSMPASCGCSRRSSGCTSRTRCSACAACASDWSIPGLFALQVRAIAEAAAARSKAGGDPQAEIMIPLVGAVQELELIKEESLAGHRRGRRGDRRRRSTFPIGTMIELPRAALTADQIAEAAEFFSFGTNDLTQTTWGFSRDDVEGAFFADLPGEGRVRRLPVRDDRPGGRRRAGAHRRREGPATRPGIKLGVCGEHGGDPESVHFFDEVGWTTCPVRRSGSRSRGWRPVAHAVR